MRRDISSDKCKHLYLDKYTNLLLTLSLAVLTHLSAVSNWSSSKTGLGNCNFLRTRLAVGN